MSILGAFSPTGFPDIDVVKPLLLLADEQVGNSRFAVWGETSHAMLDAHCLVLQGRIFNEGKLARELGMVASGPADILLQAHRKWGTEFARHLEGEYAFSLWDPVRRRVLLGRDPSGNWPLFYSQLGGAFVFSDEIRLLLTWPGLAPRPNEQRVARWLAIHPVATHETFFTGIYAAPPGQITTFELGRVSHGRFWQPENTPILRLRDSRDYGEGLREVLARSVGDRLPVGTEIATQLSGGLDSSTVTATAARLLESDGRRLCAFTAVPRHPIPVEGPGHFSDEREHAASVAQMYPNIDHRIVPHGTHRLFTLIDLFGAAQGEPIFNPSNYDWLYEMSLQAQRGGRETMLVGTSGNFTISFGDPRVLHTLLGEGRLLAMATLVRDFRRAGSRSWRGMAHELLRPRLNSRIRRAIDLVRGRPSRAQDYSMMRQEFALQHGVGGAEAEDSQLQLDSRALRLLLLRRVDNGPVASAFRRLSGVSMTDPCGDPRVVEFCLSVPVEHFCERGVPRSLIRDAMVGRLPEAVRTERRRGRQAADSAILFKSEREEAKAELRRLKKSDLAARALNLPAMEALLSQTEAEKTRSGGVLGDATLQRSFSIGRFLRRFEENSLFKTPRARGRRAPRPR